METIFFRTIKSIGSKLLCLFLIGMLFITSCRGDDGAEGPEGPMGNANVQLFTIDNPTWSANSIYFNNAAITQEVLDKSAILTYMVFNEYPEITYHVPGLGFDNLFQIRVFSQLGVIRLAIRDSDGTPFSGTLPSVLKVKVIIIESGTTGKMSVSSVEKELKNAGIDIKDYEAVKQYYNIKD